MGPQPVLQLLTGYISRRTVKCLAAIVVLGAWLFVATGAVKSGCPGSSSSMSPCMGRSPDDAWPLCSGRVARGIAAPADGAAGPGEAASSTLYSQAVGTTTAWLSSPAAPTAVPEQSRGAMGGTKDPSTWRRLVRQRRPGGLCDGLLYR